MKRFISFILVAVAQMCAAIALSAEAHGYIAGPNGITTVYLYTFDGKAYYQVEHQSNPFISTSRLGMRTNNGDFSQLEFVGMETSEVSSSYRLNRSKTSEVDYEATKAVCTFRNPEGKTIQVEQGVSPQIVEQLCAWGHEVQVIRDPITMGRGEIILRDSATGVLYGAAEPRCDGTVSCY